MDTATVALLSILLVALGFGAALAIETYLAKKKKSHS